jgi:hypothetical protein
MTTDNLKVPFAKLNNALEIKVAEADRVEQDCRDLWGKLSQEEEYQAKLISYRNALRTHLN